MEHRNNSTVLWQIVAVCLTIAIVLVVITKPVYNFTPQVQTCKEDSLQNVINQLIIEKEFDEDGWDEKEKRYEQIIFEYEFGLDHLKNYHPTAYKEFHRIVGYKENYSHEVERENKIRLKKNKW